MIAFPKNKSAQSPMDDSPIPFEEKILELQQRKKQLSERLITSDNGFVKQLTREDLEVLFSEKI